ncbi:hypothetical protein M1523_04260 [Patescibacteria group bacterium]|nr:hypothetical protein [Patescibacteria group bacterium]MCL5091753.1 hypothetical protein [Patescibacteria group bacterium]
MTTKLFSGIVYLAVAAALVFFTSPQSPLLIAGFIVSAGAAVIQIAGLRLRRKDSYLLGLFLAGLMTITVLAGFTWFNSVLLLVFFVGVKIMLK